MSTTITYECASIKETLLEQLYDIINMIENIETVATCGKKLKQIEYEIVSKTDAIAGTAIQAIVQQSIQSDEMISEGRKLAKSSPSRMKNHGKRTVTIYPYRGSPFTATTTYYTRAGTSHKKEEKKRRAIS